MICPSGQTLNSAPHFCRVRCREGLATLCSDVVEWCRATSNIVESNLIKVKIAERKFARHFYCLRILRVLLSAFGHVLDFLLDTAELAYVHLDFFPPKSQWQRLCQTRISQYSAIKTRSS